MPANIEKIETYLKKLAEKRAGAAGDVERYSKATEQSAKLLAKAQVAAAENPEAEPKVKPASLTRGAAASDVPAPASDEGKKW